MERLLSPLALSPQTAVGHQSIASPELDAH